jgi:hypothetical protein
MTARPHSHIYYVSQSFALINYFRYHIGWYSHPQQTQLRTCHFLTLHTKGSSALPYLIMSVILFVYPIHIFFHPIPFILFPFSLLPNSYSLGPENSLIFSRFLSACSTAGKVLESKQLPLHSKSPLLMICKHS